MKFQPFAAILLLACYHHGASGQTCVNAPGRIVCDGVSGIEELARQLSEFQMTSNSIMEGSVFFTNLENMPCLPPPTMFGNLSIRHFELSGFDLPFWNSPVYNGSKDGFKRVGQLFLDKMGCIQNWDWEEIDRFTGRNIFTLHITDSRFVRLPSQLKVIYGDHVDWIRIISNKVRWLDENSLNCPRCTKIYLQGNEIENLSKEAFGLGLTSLAELYLSGNRIRTLARDLFQNFGSIIGNNNDEFVLELSGNPLERFEEETFTPLKNNRNLKKITIGMLNTFETLKCNCELKWLIDAKFNIENIKCTSPGGSNMFLQLFLEAACTRSRRHIAI